MRIARRGVHCFVNFCFQCLLVVEGIIVRGDNILSFVSAETVMLEYV